MVKRSTDMVRAPAEPSLAAAEKKLLAEALRRGEETRDVMEDALVQYVRVREVFAQVVCAAYAVMRLANSCRANCTRGVARDSSTQAPRSRA